MKKILNIAVLLFLTTLINAQMMSPNINLEK